jgi:hypothetical protein
VIMAAVLAAAILATPTPPPLLAEGKETGRQPSAYTGTYYNQEDEPYRQCVAQREGRFQYWGTGSGGMYQGTYQMTVPLAHGAVWMMQAEWAQQFGRAKARQMRQTLHDTPPRKWSREVWDQAFWTVLNWEGVRSGAHHWAGGRHHCQPGMATYGGNR